MTDTLTHAERHPSTRRSAPAILNGTSLFFADATALVASAAVAFLLGIIAAPILTGPVYVHFGEAAADRWPAFVATGLVIQWWLHAHGHYSERIPLWTELKDLFQVAAMAVGIEGFLDFAVKADVSRLWVVAGWTLFPAISVLFRAAVKRALTAAGTWTIRTVIFGDRLAASAVAEALAAEPMLGFLPVAVMTHLKDPATVPVTMRGFNAGFAVFALPNSGDPSKVLEAVRVASDSDTSFAVAPPFSGLSLAGMRSQFIFGRDIMLFMQRRGLLRAPAQMAKRSLDIAGSASILILLCPVLAILALAVRSDGGPVLFGHERIGRDGKRFRCFKFRTMMVDASERLDKLLAEDPVARAEWKQDRKLRNDPRLTRYGSFMRRTALDELPQLWNVLTGSMSLVGPRPVVEDELIKYGREKNAYLKVRPGVTGLWQVSGRNDLDYDRRVALDAWYVRNWALGYDILILILTIPVLISRRGAY